MPEQIVCQEFTGSGIRAFKIPTSWVGLVSLKVVLTGGHRRRGGMGALGGRLAIGLRGHINRRGLTAVAVGAGRPAGNPP